MTLTHYDVCVVGGGILGVGVAADAASRGLSVCLFEKDDFAQGTSSRSSSLIHGGLRYLEQYEFRLVQEALREQACLLRRAPHLVHPLPFYLPVTKQSRPAWLLKLGLTLYDWMSARPLPKSRSIQLSSLQPHSPLDDEYQKAFAYYDCQTDDSRLVITNALYAKSQGAQLHNYHEVTETLCHGDRWHIHVNHQSTPQISARLLVRAIGPWGKQSGPVRLIQGSHLVVKQQYPGHFGFFLPLPDSRLFFVTPYHQHWTMIGTTEKEYTGDLNAVTMSAEERDYLLMHYNRYFSQKITQSDICHAWSGVRALFAESDQSASQLSREHVITLEAPHDAPPQMSIFGGKLTTYRAIAQEAVDQCTAIFDNLSASKTLSDPLPGHIVPSPSQWPWMPDALYTQLLYNYGGLLTDLLSGCTDMADLGAEIAPGLYEKEINYVIQSQWARTADDILWRRTKKGLSITDTDKQTLEQYLAHR